MAHDEGCTPLFSTDASQHVNNEAGTLGIKCRGRFIKKDERLGQCKGCSKEYALALSAGKFRSLELKHGVIKAESRKEGWNRHGGSAFSRAICCKIMCQGYQVAPRSSQWLQFLRHIGRQAAYGINIALIKRLAAHLHAARRQRHEAEHEAQQ